MTWAPPGFWGQEVAAFSQRLSSGCSFFTHWLLPAALLQMDTPRWPVPHATSISHQTLLGAEQLTFICINDLLAAPACRGLSWAGIKAGLMLVTVNKRPKSIPSALPLMCCVGSSSKRCLWAACFHGLFSGRRGHAAYCLHPAWSHDQTCFLLCVQISFPRCIPKQ